MSQPPPPPRRHHKSLWHNNWFKLVALFNLLAIAAVALISTVASPSSPALIPSTICSAVLFIGVFRYVYPNEETYFCGPENARMKVHSVVLTTLTFLNLVVVSEYMTSAIPAQVTTPHYIMLVVTLIANLHLYFATYYMNIHVCESRYGERIKTPGHFKAMDFDLCWRVVLHIV